MALNAQPAASGKLFCFGLGYSAMALARSLLADGWAVAGTCRTEEKRVALAAQGIEAHLFDRGSPLSDPAAAFAQVTHVLSSVPPAEGGDPVVDAHGSEIAAISGLRWVGYLSTTGVYGDRDGAWVDEATPPAPTTDRGRQRQDAEQAWCGLYQDHGLPVHLFRLAGIYGPGRNQLESVRAGKARRIDKPGQVFSRIHVDDIVSVLRASMVRPNPGAAYNVCDDEPAPSREVVEFACQLLGVEAPPLVALEDAGLTPMGLSFFAENKRVGNNRIKTDLGVRLRFPTYREGLQALLGH
jgi:nucleoside-diphosphate-sugar epimerase